MREVFKLFVTWTALIAILGAVVEDVYLNSEILKEEKKQTKLKRDLVRAEQEKVYHFKRAELIIDQLIKMRKDEKGSN